MTDTYQNPGVGDDPASVNMSQPGTESDSTSNTAEKEDRGYLVHDDTCKGCVFYGTILSGTPCCDYCAFTGHVRPQHEKPRDCSVKLSGDRHEFMHSHNLELLAMTFVDCDYNGHDGNGIYGGYGGTNRGETHERWRDQYERWRESHE